SVTNLTEQRRALEALRESEERFRTLVRDIHVGVVMSGPQGKMTFANQAALNMFGVSEMDAIGRHASDIGLTFLDEHGSVRPLERYPAATVFRSKRALRNRTMGWRRLGMFFFFQAEDGIRDPG